MGMASDLLERLSEDLEVLSLHTRAYLDEFGTLLCYLEGGRGGGTTLLHAPYTEALPVLQALNGLAFRGRVLLALDPPPLPHPGGPPPHRAHPRPPGAPPPPPPPRPPPPGLLRARPGAGLPRGEGDGGGLAAPRGRGRAPPPPGAKPHGPPLPRAPGLPRLGEPAPPRGPARDRGPLPRGGRAGPGGSHLRGGAGRLEGELGGAFPPLLGREVWCTSRCSPWVRPW